MKALFAHPDMGVLDPGMVAKYINATYYEEGEQHFLPGFGGYRLLMPYSSTAPET